MSITSINDAYVGQSTIPVWTWYPINYMEVDKKFWPKDGDKVVVVNKRRIFNSDKYVYDYCVATASVSEDYFSFRILGKKNYQNLIRWAKIMDEKGKYE